MKHFYRRGYEKIPTGYVPKWYEWILFFWFIENILYYKKEFVDLIDDKGNITRIYPKENEED